MGSRRVLGVTHGERAGLSTGAMALSPPIRCELMSADIQLAAEYAHQLPRLIGSDHDLDQLASVIVVDSRNQDIIAVALRVSRGVVLTDIRWI